MASEFWDTVRLVSKAVSTALNGRASTQAIRQATPLQRAFAVGAVPGSPVTNKWEELGHDTSWNYVGVHTVAKMWALASWTLYAKRKQVNKRLVTKGTAQDAPDEQRQAIEDHPALDLLENPNPCMTRMQFMYIVGTHLRLTGGWAILEIRGVESKVPVEMYPIPRAWMTYMPPSEQYPMGWYQVRNPKGTTAYFAGNAKLASGFEVDAREMMIGGWPHPMYPGEQISPLSACGRIIDIMEQTDHAVWSSLLNAYHNGMILLLDAKAGPQNSEDLTKMVSKLSDAKGGVTNAGKIAALYGVQSIERPGTPLSEMMAVDIREQNKKFGLGIQGVPGVATGMRDEIGSYAGDAATMNAFAEWGIGPDLELFAACLNARWKRYWADVKLEASPKRTDDPQLVNQRRDQLFAGIEKGAVSINEWRASIELPPVPGGDELKEAPDPNAQQMGPDGQPIPGGNDQPGADQPQDDGQFDLGVDDEPDAADEKTGGFKRPDLSKAGGRPFSVNGRGGH